MQLTTESQALRQKVKAFYQDVNYPRADLYRMNRKAHAEFNIAGCAPFTDQKMKILVVGCGTCEAPAIANANPDSLVTGIDFSQSSISIAKSIKRANGFDNLKLINADFLDTNFKSEFGWATLTGVLHHIPEADIALQKVYDALIDGGILMGMVYSDQRPSVIRELNSEFTSKLMTADEVLKYFQETGGNEFYNIHNKTKNEIADTWLHPYFTEYSLDSIKEKLKAAGFNDCRSWYPENNYKVMFIARKGKPFKMYDNGNISVPFTEIGFA